MKVQRNMQSILNGRRYNCSTATLLCGNDWWDGNNYERSGENTYLFRTLKGSYFFQHLTQWSGKHDYLETCTEGEAQAFFEACDAHDCCNVEFEEAFPNVTVEDA